jgi:hypothetical protein
MKLDAMLGLVSADGKVKRRSFHLGKKDHRAGLDVRRPCSPYASLVFAIISPCQNIGKHQFCVSFRPIKQVRFDTSSAGLCGPQMEGSNGVLTDARQSSLNFEHYNSEYILD